MKPSFFKKLSFSISRLLYIRKNFLCFTAVTTTSITISRWREIQRSLDDDDIFNAKRKFHSRKHFNIVSVFAWMSLAAKKRTLSDFPFDLRNSGIKSDFKSWVTPSRRLYKLVPLIWDSLDIVRRGIVQFSRMNSSAFSRLSLSSLEVVHFKPTLNLSSNSRVYI